MRVSPLSRCLAVTVAPGTTAPVASRTVPTMAAVEPWAKIRQLPNAINAMIAIPALTVLFLIQSPFLNARYWSSLQAMTLRSLEKNLYFQKNGSTGDDSGNYFWSSGFVKEL